MSNSEYILPTENLVVEGIPPIPAALAAEVERYTTFRPSGFLGWHPVERAMLIARRAGNSAQAFRLDQPGAEPVQITSSPDSIEGAAYAPISDPYMLLRRGSGGNEYGQFYRLDSEAAEPVLVTDGTSRNTTPVWSRGGDRLAYGTTRRNGSDVDLHIVDPRDPAGDRLLREFEGGGLLVFDWSPDDSRIVICTYISTIESYLWIVDVDSGTMHPLTPRVPGTPVSYFGAAFSADGRSVYTTGNPAGEFRRLYEIDVETGAMTPLGVDAPWDVEEFALSAEGRVLAYTLNENGCSALHLIDLATGAELAVPKMPAGILAELTWHRSRAELAFTFNSAITPSDVYSYDLHGGSLTRWTNTDLGDLTPEAFVEPELIHWTSFDGLRISGFLYRPPKRWEGRRPVIVNIHGGPASQARPEFLGRMNYVFTELGVAMIRPNVRGSRGYGTTFVTLDDGYRREDSYRDIEALFDWIAEQPDLDPERVMVRGGSYGGYMVLIVAVRYPERICCAMDIVGISNLVTFLENTADYRRDLRRPEYGDERDPAMRAFMERTAPLNNAEKITKPILIVQGANDPRVPLSEAEQMVARLRAIGTPVGYLMARDEGHGFRKKSNQDFEFYTMVMFVREHLVGEL